MDTEVTERFSHLFEGNRSAWGTYEITGNEGDKLIGKAITRTGQLTFDEYSDHVNGKVSLGVVPIQKDGTCIFCALDADYYNGKSDQYLKMALRHNFPLVPFRSKSGGLHLYLFFASPVPAKDARVIMATFRDLLCLPRQTEIFPKQDVLPEGSCGNWINLPYFDAENSARYMYDSLGASLSFREAVDACYERKVTLQQAKDFIDLLPYNDAPPCIQKILLSGECVQRNVFMLSVGVYLKAKYGDGFEEELYKANACLNMPLSEQELKSTVIKSLTTKSYTYKCKDAPLHALCNSQACKQRKYCVGERVSALEYGTFTKYNTDPPRYSWIVNGVNLEFSNARDIMSQDKFRELVFTNLDMLPEKVSEAVWTGTVNLALKNVVIEDAVDDSLSSFAAIQEVIMDYFVTAEATLTLTDAIQANKPYFHSERMTILFKQTALLSYIKNRLGASAKTEDVMPWLRRHGVSGTSRKIGARSMWLLEAPLDLLFPDAQEREDWITKQLNEAEEMNTYLSGAKDRLKDMLDNDFGEDLV